MRKGLFISLCLVHFFTCSQIELKDFREKQRLTRNFTCDEIYDYASSLSNKTDSTYFYYFSARSQFCSSNYFKAYKSYVKVLENFHGKNHVLEAEIQIEIATCLSILSQKGEALNYFLKAKKQIDANKDRELKIKFHLAFGEFQRKYAEFDKAELVLRKGFLLIKDDLYFQASYLNRLAAIKTEKTEKDSSLFYSNKALVIAYELNNNHLIATSENEIAFIYRHTNSWPQALEKYQRAENYWTKAGMILYALEAKVSSVSVMDDKKYKYRNQKRILLNALNIASNNNWHQTELTILPVLMNIYHALNKKDSIDFYHIYLLNSEIKLLNSKNKTNTSFVQLKFDQEKNKNTISRQAASIKSKQKQNLFYSILIAAFGMILILLTYILFLQIKRKKRISLEKLQQETKNKELELLVKEKTALVQEVHHRVKNNLQFMEAMVHMQADLTENNFGKDALQEISRRLKSMSLVHEMIYTNESLEYIPMCEYLKQLLHVTKDILENKAQNIDFELNCEKIDFDINKTMAIGIIVSELINNSVKYAFENKKNPKIKIDLKIIKQGSISLTYYDNGTGYELENSKKGLGLKLIDIFSRQLKGEYLIKANDGFVYEIIFPHVN